MPQIESCEVDASAIEVHNHDRTHSDQRLVSNKDHLGSSVVERFTRDDDCRVARSLIRQLIGGFVAYCIVAALISARIEWETAGQKRKA